MELQQQNVYILEENTLPAIKLKNFLHKKFKDTLNISMFTDGASLIKKIDASTAIAIIDYELKGEQTDELISKIKRINANTKVIALASDEEIAAAITDHRKGIKNVVVKGKGELKRIHTILLTMLYYPVRIIQRFFGFQELAAIFIVEILFVGIVVILGFEFLRN